MKEYSRRPCAYILCGRLTWHDMFCSLRCERMALELIGSPLTPCVADRLAARATDHARDGAALPSLGAAPFLAAVASTHGNASRDRGTPSTGPALASSTDVKQRGQSMTYRGQEG